MHFSPAYSGHSLPGADDITRVELPNGIVVLSRANFNSPSVIVHGYLFAGGLFDPGEKLGLADFCASALMRGTGRRSFHEIFDALESCGASLGISGGTHTTSFHGKALAEDLGLLLDLLADSLRQPVFPPQEMERLRAQLLTGLAIRAQDTGEMAGLAFDELVYAGHPYSRPQDGFPETIQAIQPSDLLEFHARHYGPRGMALAVVGAVETSQAVDLAAQALGDWRNPRQPPVPQVPPAPELAATATRVVHIPGKSQAAILIGAPGPSRRSPDFLAASLGNNVLGQFGLMGRIGDVVRERAGLAYSASSMLSGGMGPGPWYVSAGVAPDHIEQTVALCRQEIERFIREPVSPEELADSKANYIGRLPISLEANAGVASALINLERYDLGLDYYRRYPDLINAITADEILQSARRYLDPERLGIAIAGP